MSKNDDVCQNMMKVLNEDLRQYGEIKFDQHGEFAAIKWEEKRRYRINEKGEKDYGNVYTKGPELFSMFDINNDMLKEVVVKSVSGGLKGIPSDTINVFRGEDIEYFKDGIETTQGTYSRTIAGFGIMGPFLNNGYELREIPPAQIMPRLGTKKNVPIYHFLGGWFYFNPFLYKGVYYVTMTDWQPYESEINKWFVILKLNPDNQIKDICYYQKKVKSETKKSKRR